VIGCVWCFAGFDIFGMEKPAFVALEVLDSFISEETVETFVECCLGDLWDVQSQSDKDGS
jgi:hypothetical protein